jgi:hypothetical protein
MAAAGSVFEKTDAKLAALKKELEGGSEHASAIVGGVFLDGLLGELLRTFFVDDSDNEEIFEYPGILASFAAKIQIAYRLGVISLREYQTLNTIRRIRNDFAHPLGEISFSDEFIKARCKNIETPVTMILPEQVLVPEGEAEVSLPIRKADSDDPRACFLESVLALAWVLFGRIADAFESKRSRPSDFVAAHEPAAQLLRLARDQVQNMRALVEAKLPREEASKHDSGFEALERIMVRPLERMIAHIKAAHEGRSRQE